MLRATLSHLAPAAVPRAPAAAELTKPRTPRPHRIEDDPPGADKLGLTAAEIEHFKTLGYIIKRRLIPPSTFAPLVDSLWADFVPPCIDRHDASTWVDPHKNPGWGPSKEVIAETRRTGRTNRPWVRVQAATLSIFICARALTLLLARLIVAASQCR